MYMKSKQARVLEERQLSDQELQLATDRMYYVEAVEGSGLSNSVGPLRAIDGAYDWGYAMIYGRQRASANILRSLGLFTLLLSMMTTAHALPVSEVETLYFSDTERAEDVSGIQHAYDGHPAGGVVIGCPDDADSTGRIQLAARNCPDGDCAPPPPPDDDPPDPNNPPPQPPPPEIIRQIIIPADFITNMIKVGIFGTVLQVSHTDGDPLSLWAMAERCQPAPSPGREACLEQCKDVPPKNHGQCMSSCMNHGQTCGFVCGSYNSLSYLQWGITAKDLSRKQQCDASTCPACVATTQVPSLRDVDLPVNVFHKEWDPWPLPKYSVTCRINRFQFRAEPNPVTGKQVEVNVSADGLTVHIPGTAGSPGIRCAGAPDVYVENLGLKLSLRMAPYGLAVIAKGELDGNFSTVVTGGIIVDQALKDVFTEVASNRLNAPDKRELFLGLLRGLTDKYIEQNHLDPRVGEVSSIRFSQAGMTVVYFMSTW
jgi:hypothetical protein